MNSKMVSVCINAYNAEKFILKTINSVLNQTYKNLQIIIVDDCSTDDTFNLIKAIDDERIELYQTPFNCHISNACNETFKHIKGDYVAHLDADDLWAEDKIEKQVAFLEQNPKYGACFTHAEIIDENDNIADESQNYLREIYAFDNRSQAEIYRYFFDNSNKLCHPSSLIRTEIIKKVGNHDTSMLYLHDFDYWMRLITVCHIYVIPERLTLVRRHGDNNSDVSTEKWIAHNNETAKIIYKSINICPDSLFLEAFKDKLKFKGEHSHEETELEKAFLLLEGPHAYKRNPILGIYKFSELFQQEKFVRLSVEKFGFTTRDLYTIQETRCFLDVGEYNHLVGSVNKLNGELENEIKIKQEISLELEKCQKYIIDLEMLKDSSNAHINNLENYVKSLENYVQHLENDLAVLNKNFYDIKNSLSWKVTAPLRFVSNKLKKLF